jgi:glycosyltransferase 2 family protein
VSGTSTSVSQTADWPPISRPRPFPWLRIAIGLLVSTGLLWLAARQVDWVGLVQIVAGVAYPYVLAATGVYFIDLGLRAWRWRILLSGTTTVPTRRLYSVLAIGYMANNLLPIRIGELSRAYLVGRRENLDASVVLASVAVERIVDGLTVVALLFATLPLLPVIAGADDAWLGRMAGAAGITFGAGVVIVVALALGRSLWLGLAKAGLWYLPLVVRGPALHLLNGFIEGLGVLGEPRRLLVTLVLSVAIWVVGAGTYYLSAAAFGITLPPVACLTAICVVNLATAVPLAPAGFGAFEAIAQRLLVLVGVGVTPAFGITILLHSVLFFPVVIVGLAFLWRSGFSIGHLWTPHRIWLGHAGAAIHQ